MTRLSTHRLEELDFSEQMANNAFWIGDIADDTVFRIDHLLEDDRIGQTMSDFLDTIDRQRSTVDNVNAQLDFVWLHAIAA